MCNKIILCKDTDRNILLEDDLENKPRSGWSSFIISTFMIAISMSLNSILFVLYPFFLFNFLSLSLDSATMAVAAVAAGDFSGRFLISCTKVKENVSSSQERPKFLTAVIAAAFVVIVMTNDWHFAALMMLSFLLGVCRGLMMMTNAVTHAKYFSYKTNPMAFAFASMIVAATFVLLGPVLDQYSGDIGKYSKMLLMIAAVFRVWF